MNKDSDEMVVPTPRPRKLKNLHLNRVDLVTAGANPGAYVMIHKFEEDMKELEAIMVDETVETPEVPAEETKVEIETVVETVAKADFEALQKSLELATERLAKMEHEAKEVEFIAKAKDLSNLGAAPELGRLMLDINKNVSAESYKALEMLLKAANAQLEKGDLFASLGRSDAEAATSGDRILELAKAKVEAGTARTIELAKLDVMRENSDLRAEYMKAKGHRVSYGDPE